MSFSIFGIVIELPRARAKTVIGLLTCKSHYEKADERESNRDCDRKSAHLQKPSVSCVFSKARGRYAW